MTKEELIEISESLEAVLAGIYEEIDRLNQIEDFSVSLAELEKLF